MENMELSGQVQELRADLVACQHEVKTAQRQAWLARRHAHLARHAIGNYELHIDILLDEMRQAGMRITPLMRPRKIREQFQMEMEKLEKLEGVVTQEAIITPTGESNETIRGSQSDQSENS